MVEMFLRSFPGGLTFKNDLDWVQASYMCLGKKVADEEIMLPMYDVQPCLYLGLNKIMTLFKLSALRYSIMRMI